MRNLLLSLLLVPAIGAFAQQPVPPAPPAGANWQHVQALPIGASLQVKAGKHHANCTLKSVDADTLTCTSGKDVVFQRAEISSIQIPRRGASAAIMAGVGAGVGAAAVKIVASTAFFKDGKAKGSVYAAGAGLGALIFGPIGYFTHPIRSTVYTAP